MKKIVKGIGLLTMVFLTACSSRPSLQEYYIASKENSNFISLDVPASVLNIKNEELSEKEQKAIASLKKFNFLAFKKTADNGADYKIEKEKVQAILKDERFVELMKVNTEYGKGVVKYLGEEDAINEVILFGDSNQKGFALVRILGNGMNPAHIVQLMRALQKSDYDGNGLNEIVKFLGE